MAEILILGIFIGGIMAAAGFYLWVVSTWRLF